MISCLLAVIASSGIGTFAILAICRLTTGLRLTSEQDIEGLDYPRHGEIINL